jgi:L-rhamnose-H+ transport protein
MDTNLFFVGFLLMLAGGIFQGTFSFPLKYTSRWSWENTWGAGSLMALLLLPWPLAFLTVPDLREVYKSVPVSGIVLALLFGAGWGTGGIFFGKGLASTGFSIGLALIMGIVAIGGSVIPLAMNQPEAFLKLPGLVLLAGVAVMIAGLVVSARAGILKESDQQTRGEEKSRNLQKATFRKGLIYCVLAGLLSSLVNFGFIYGSSLSKASIAMGADPVHSQNALLALVFTSNFLVNIGFCLYLLIKNKTFNRFALKGTSKYWIMVIVMGLLWSGGIVIYGMGTTMIGNLGAYLGFPVLMVVSIITGNIFGVLTGEWKGVSPGPKRLMGLGIIILVAAIILLGLSMNLT